MWYIAALLWFLLCRQLTEDDVFGIDNAASSPASIKRVQSMPASKQTTANR